MNTSTASVRSSFAKRFAVAALSLSLAGVSAAAPAAEAAPRLKIATVDMQTLFKTYYKTVQSQKEVNETRTKIKKEADERGARLKELEASLTSMKKQLEDPSIADAKKQSVYTEFKLKQEEGAALQRQSQEFLEGKNKALNEDMITRMKALTDEIQATITAEAKAEDFDYVFDKSGMSTSQVPFLLYTKDATDLTEELLKKLNKDAPAPAADDKKADDGAKKADEKKGK